MCLSFGNSFKSLALDFGLDNTVAALPTWSPEPRCVLECPYPSYVPPGHRINTFHIFFLTIFITLCYITLRLFILLYNYIKFPLFLLLLLLF